MPDWGKLFRLRHEGIKGFIAKAAKLHGKKKDKEHGGGIWDFDIDVSKYLKEMKDRFIDHWMETGWIGPIRPCEWEDILKFEKKMRRKVYGKKGKRSK